MLRQPRQGLALSLSNIRDSRRFTHFCPTSAFVPGSSPVCFRTSLIQPLYSSYLPLLSSFYLAGATRINGSQDFPS